MKTRKTLRLPEDYAIDDTGVVVRRVRTPESYDGSVPETWDWQATPYKIGAQAVLVSTEAAEATKLDYSLAFDSVDEGIPGNLRPSVCRYHGWRGTTNGQSVYAHGRREIIAIRQLANQIAVTVGPDLAPEQP